MKPESLASEDPPKGTIASVVPVPRKSSNANDKYSYAYVPVPTQISAHTTCSGDATLLSAALDSFLQEGNCESLVQFPKLLASASASSSCGSSTFLQHLLDEDPTKAKAFTSHTVGNLLHQVEGIRSAALGVLLDLSSTPSPQAAPEDYYGRPPPRWSDLLVDEEPALIPTLLNFLSDAKDADNSVFIIAKNPRDLFLGDRATYGLPGEVEPSISSDSSYMPSASRCQLVYSQWFCTPSLLGGGDDNEMSHVTFTILARTVSSTLPKGDTGSSHSSGSNDPLEFDMSDSEVPSSNHTSTTDHGYAYGQCFEIVVCALGCFRRRLDDEFGLGAKGSLLYFK